MPTNQELIEAIFNDTVNQGADIKAVMERIQPITEFTDAELAEAQSRLADVKKSIANYKQWMARNWWK